MARTYVGVRAMHELDGSITPLVIHWPDGRNFEVDRLLDVRPAPTVGSGLGKRYVCRIYNKQVNLFRDNLDGKWYIEH
ncbi:hypothetical protein [Sporomusa aerivorans]|uniref:hypothetical protein n=1 Tax=Sporomusa aerivorans TaxID=204936 RepID=UPI00352A22CA